MQGWAFLTFVNISLLAVNYTLASSVAPALFGYVGTVDNTLLITAGLSILQALILTFSTALAGHVNNVAVVTEIVGTIGLSIALAIALAVNHHFHWGNLFQPEHGHTGSFISPGDPIPLGLVAAGAADGNLLPMRLRRLGRHVRGDEGCDPPRAPRHVDVDGGCRNCRVRVHRNAHRCLA